ncbi:MAG: PEGA domain-containing protein, partial [Acidobacteria bacterium]|nr:PEGA domain-containing protein [Acidobacteriota bacterium]
GSGVLGPVFRTYDPQADRLVAVKAFRLDLLPEDVARLADGLRRLVGTAGYLAAGLEGTTAYVAMEYHAAETFDVALRHLAPAPLETALPILRSLAEAIDAAWAAGPAFGHGALHPRDVFVTPGTDAVHVTGFGIAPALEAIGARPPVRRPYTAPERAFGEGWDQRADVFSLGAIAHELLTGRRPAGPGEQDGSLPASLPPELRVQIRRVLSKALAESPAHRFGSAREFIATLTDPSTLVESDPLAAAPIAAPFAMPIVVGPDVVSPLPTPPAQVSQTEETTQTEEASDDAPPMPAPTPAPPPRRVRARAPITTPRSPLLDSPVPAVPPVIDVMIADAPVASDDLPLDVAAAATAQRAPLVLPSPYPWAAFAAAIVASAIIFFVIGYQIGTRRGAPAVPPVSAPAANASAAPERPSTLTGTPAPANTATPPAAGDTEVAVNEPVAPGKSADAAPAKPVADATPGRLVIRSTPTGAAVTINGKPAGRTPLTARDLTLATHTVVVSRPGFVSETRKVPLTRRAPSTTLSVRLSAERPAAARGASTGTINVDSRPKGAQVTIDGRALGATPLSAPGFAPGTHSVRVELAGYKPVTTSVTVKAGETARVAVTLEQR